MATKNNSDFIDIKGLLAQYRSKWYYFVISLVLCGALAVAFIKLRTPEYGVRANVLITKDDTGGMGMLGSLFGSQGDVEDEIFIVSSHTVLRDVCNDLGLYKNHTVSKTILPKQFAYKEYPVEVYPAEGITDTLRTAIVFKLSINNEGKADVVVKAKRHTIAEVEDGTFPLTFDLPYGKFMLNTTPFYEKGESVRTTITVKGIDAAAEDLALDVTSDIADKHTNVIALGINTTNPEYGEDVLNNIIKKYNARRINDQNKQNAKTAEFLDSRIALISADLTDAEDNIQSYKTDQGIIDVSSEASYNMAKRGNLENRLANAQTQLEILDLNRDFLNDPANAYSLLPASGGENALSNAMATYNELILKRMEIMNNAKPNNVTLRQLTDQIDAMRESIKSSLEKSYRNEAIVVRDLQKEMDRTQAKLGNVPQQERAYINMKRQQDIKQQLYLYLLQRREETAMLLANAQPKSMVIDEAYTMNEPLGLGKMAILVIAIVFGLAIPPSILYIKHLLRDKFATRSEVEDLTDIPVLGEMCTIHNNEDSNDAIVVGNQNYSTPAELFRLMRTNLQFVLNGKDDKVVLVTSTVSGEGKSFIAINLAASLALLNKRVVLLGMDIRNPKLREYLNLPPKKGLTELLSSPGMTLDDVIIPSSEIPGLDIITAGPVPPNPNELLASSTVDNMFEQLRERYDYIIIDSAPVGMVGDTFTLARVSDATVYVCRANYTSLRDVKFFDDIYADNRLRKMTLVVNGTNDKHGYGYGYGYKSSNNSKRK